MDKIIRWAESLMAIAHNGLLFSKNEFDVQRYKQIQVLATAILSYKSTYSEEKIQSLFATERGYLTPKIDVRGAVFDKQHRILLVKENSDGRWSLPGGWVEVNESPSQAITKEIFEESGFETEPVKLFAVYDKHCHAHPPQVPHAHKLFFLCKIMGGQKSASIETSDVEFFAKENIPPLSLNRVVPLQIERAFQHYYAPELPTEFD